MKNKIKLSLKSRMIGLMILCWLVPLVLITGANLYYLSSDRFQNKISKEIEQLKSSDEISGHRLDELIQESREASYDGTIVDLYERYQEGAIPKNSLINGSGYYLKDNYSLEDGIKMALLWYRDDPKNFQCSAYNTSAGGTYAYVKKYWEEDHNEIFKISENLDTRIAFYSNNDRLYLIRNVMTPDYENIATLIFCVSQPHCFKNYFSPASKISNTVWVDDCIMTLQGEQVTKEETGMNDSDGNYGYRWENGVLRIFHTLKNPEYTLTSLVRFDDSSQFGLFYGFRAIFIAQILCIVPLILIVLHVFSKHMTEPVRVLMEASSEIEAGNLGFQIEDAPDSTEFGYLTESFNNMSNRLKYQFDHIYEEEVALRDARIKALQAHINPHFMNNTLEIINWEARLGGNEKVSKMIGALSVLMDAGIDRKKQPLVTLREEMNYVNSYLYIISERLGKRLTIENLITKDLMNYKVPRLIMQPVIENAIEHGVVMKGKGTVTLKGYTAGDFLYLDIINESVLTNEDKEKVARLLDVKYDTTRETSENLGIANVNQRLRILFGEGAGLSVYQMDETHVCSHLSIKIVNEIIE